MTDLSNESRREAISLEAELVAVLDRHREEMLRIGAAGRLLITGEVKNVLPLEEDGAIENSKPITSDGRVSLNADKIDARQDAQLRVLRRGNPVSVIVLGGAHDLSRAIRRAGSKCEYLRVTTKRLENRESPTK